MSEIIDIGISDLKVMSEDALDFFAEEIRDDNVISVIRENGQALKIDCIQDWQEFLVAEKLIESRVKKNIRI